MSYILEALKKAEAERRQEKVPGIHTQPLAAASLARRESRWQRALLWIAAACASAIALLAAIWLAPWQSTPASVQIAQAPVPVAPVAPPMAVPAPVPHRESKVHEKEKPVAPTVSVPVETHIPTLRELPEQIQREIPEFKVGGYIYADKPADRSVLINNRLLHEGDEAAPGVTLERMQKNGMILHYKKYRFRTSY
jgi:general secretion pathway protein B